MIRAAVYVRKSSDDTDRDAEAQSCQRQIDAATRYASEQGWTVDPRYVYRDDAVSGAEWKHRDGWNKLLADLEPAPPFSRLIVSELSNGDGYSHYVINPIEAGIVREIFQWFDEGMGVMRIVKRLNDRGVPAPRGGSKGWVPASVALLLRRPIYAGCGCGIVERTSCARARAGRSRLARLRNGFPKAYPSWL